MTTRKSSRPEIKNYILNALPKEDLARLLPDLKEVEFASGQILHRMGEPIEYLYFPEEMMNSTVGNTSAGQTIEVGVIGREGLVGFNVLMSALSMPHDNMTQLPGSALQISTAAITREFKRGGALHDCTLRFVYTFLLQISQTALCNRLHTIDERLARWLLMSHDRSATDELKLTQEFLAIMLGANRASVTLSAIALQDTGYIKYSRGRITIIDRKSLENYSCECYKAVKREYDKLAK